MCAWSRENSHHFGVLDNQVRCSRGTHRRWSGQLAAVAVSDLLTVRGAAKPVKPARTWGDLGIVVADVQSTRRRPWRISPTRLRRDPAIASVAVRLAVSSSYRSRQRVLVSLFSGGTVVRVTGRRCFCAHSVDICVEARLPQARTPYRESAHNSRFCFARIGLGRDARRAAEVE